jgi:hypothetical protein
MNPDGLDLPLPPSFDWRPPQPPQLLQRWPSAIALLCFSHLLAAQVFEYSLPSSLAALQMFSVLQLFDREAAGSHLVCPGGSRSTGSHRLFCSQAFVARDSSSTQPPSAQSFSVAVLHFGDGLLATAWVS